MTWIGLATPDIHRFSHYGLGLDRQDTPVAPQETHPILARGTLVVEFPLTGEEGADLIAGHLWANQPAKRGIELRLIPSGGISFVQTFGAEVRHGAVRYATRIRARLIRLSYAWDTTRQWARLAVERPGSEILDFNTLYSPLPLLLDDLRHIVETGVAGGCVALSSDALPLGPSPTLASDVQVPTGFGPRALCSLKRGDTVFGPDGFSTPVLYPLRARFPAVGSFRPIRLRAPFFGLRHDIVVAATQQIVLTGSRVEYNYGQEAVLIPAMHLIGSLSAHHETSGPVVDYAQALMPMAETLKIAGTPFTTPNIGRLRRDTDTLAQTWFAGLARNVLPEHAPSGLPVRNHFETSALGGEMAA